MDWNQIWTMIGAIATIAGLMSGFFWRSFNRIDNHLLKLERQNEAQGARIDRLYEMFVDLVRSK